MPDKSNGWRKKIHSKPKDLKTASATSSRPATPARVGTPNPTVDTEDTKSELPEPSVTPRRPAKLARLVSGHPFFKDNYEKPDFVEPWSDDAPPPAVAPVDPLASLQSVFSYMNNLPSRPIPVNFYSSLFHIFEDYRKVREEKDRTKDMVQDSTDRIHAAEHALAVTKDRYKNEIRRLELLMAYDDASGMSKVIKARQGSLVERKRGPTKTQSYSQRKRACEDATMGSIEEEIRLRTQNVLLQRPLSPSGKMAALSRQFSKTSFADDLHVGAAPTKDSRTFLSPKASNELDLTSLGAVDGFDPAKQHAEADLSQDTDSTPNLEPLPALLSLGSDYDVFVALRELGTLVARKRGIDASRFVDGILRLLDMREHTEEYLNTTVASSDSDTYSTFEHAEDGDGFAETPAPTNLLRHCQSQPQLRCEQRRQRHFSFEPGDDEIKRPNGDITLDGAAQNIPLPEVAQGSEVNLTKKRKEPALPEHLLSDNLQKPSKIPSPLQRPGLGSVERTSSFSSAQRGDRRTSTSSVLTAFRQSSSGSVRSVSQNTNSSAAVIAAARATRLSGMGRAESTPPPERDDA